MKTAKPFWLTRVAVVGLVLSFLAACEDTTEPDFQLDPDAAVSRTDTTGWVEYTMPWDGAPLDLSWLNETPAGEHGFVEVSDGKFAFEDGTSARFWGVCMSAGGNFPTHEQSEKIAARMAKFGVNMVRTHHADAGWSDPNLFDESHGDTRHFDADALDRFDYFLHCLKKHGIYTYLDQLVHRRFTEGDGVVNASELDFAAKLTKKSDDETHAFIEKLWAVRRVGEILDELDLKGKNDELVKELVQLSTRHGILTPYTSFMADDTTDVRDLAANMTEASSAVMAGIAEALIATAVGLVVAIPAVIAFNIFKARVLRAVTDCHALARVLLAQLKATDLGQPGD